jgi:hypothetical protein
MKEFVQAFLDQSPKARAAIVIVQDEALAFIQRFSSHEAG